MAGIDDRLDRLERLLRPPERAAELISEQAIRDCDALAAIIRDSGPEFDNLLARVQEQHPEWSYYQQQLAVKKQLIETSGPDGPRLWLVLSSALDHGYEPPQVREER